MLGLGRGICSLSALVVMRSHTTPLIEQEVISGGSLAFFMEGIFRIILKVKCFDMSFSTLVLYSCNTVIKYIV